MHDCNLQGAANVQAVSQRATKYRLELFRTANGRGWGVRSLVSGRGRCHDLVRLKHAAADCNILM
jgi:hypothetical protein